jgi:uncharacterized protein HemY
MSFSSHQINDWLAERPWRRFWRCLPALLAGVLLLTAAGFVFGRKSAESQLRLRYKQTAIGALAAGKYELARVACLRGLSFADDERTRLEWLFYLAVALHGAGHEAEAAALLATAAPLEHPGCVPAHLAVAQSLLNATNLTPAMVQQAEKHLQSALELNPQSLEIKEQLGRLYINTHQLDKARQQLLEVYPLKNEVALLLAVVENASQNAAQTRSWADTAMDAFKKNLKDFSPRDSQPDRLGLVQACLLEEDFAGAIGTLEAGLMIHDKPAYHAMLADVCAAAAAKLSVDPKNDATALLPLIQKGLHHAPQNLELRLMLIQTARLDSDAGQAAKQSLDQLVASATGESAAWWQFLLWTDARVRGDRTAARRYLQTAYKLAPQIPAIQNDLAMDLAAGNEADAERGLKISQALVSQYPENPGFRDTRGRILARLGRNEPAAADLEFAAAKLASPADARLELAKVYQALGKTQLAEQQRRLIEIANQTK